MKRLLNIKILVFTLLLAAVSVAAVERAFSAHGTGVATFITDENGKVIGADVTSSGSATHLGRFTSVGQVSFTPDPDDPNLVHTTGEATFTGANGDKLRIVVQDGVMDLRTGIATGHFRFDGGTGRFANATGITAIVVQQDFVTGGFELTQVGKIDF